MLATTNVFITGTIGITPTDMYILYVIAIIAGIPLTGLRASIVDNTRGKAGKYRPYILLMGIPSALIFIAMVWFPYDKLKYLVGDGVVFGENPEPARNDFKELPRGLRQNRRGYGASDSLHEVRRKYERANYNA